MRRHCNRANNGGGGLKTALGWTVAGGQFSARLVNYAENITELGHLTRALVRFRSHPCLLPRAGGRFRNSENKGESGWTTRSPHHIATTDLRAACMKKYNRANITGHGPEARIGSGVPISWAFLPAGRQSLPGIYLRPRCRRGARSSLSAVVGICSAYVVTFGGEVT